MEKAKKMREELLKEYQMLDMEIVKLGIDFMDGKISQRDCIVQGTIKEFEQTKLCAELFGCLEPYFNEVKILADDIYELMVKTGSDMEDIEKSINRQEEFGKLPERHKNVCEYYREDLIHMTNLMARLERLSENRSDEEIRETVANFEIVKDVSRIYTYDKYEELFDTFQKVVSNLTEKRDKLRELEESLHN